MTPGQPLYCFELCVPSYLNGSLVLSSGKQVATEDNSSPFTKCLLDGLHTTGLRALFKRAVS